ncbi:MAG: type II and III secretion system protein family protein [Pirellulales bacterium]
MSRMKHFGRLQAQFAVRAGLATLLTVAMANTATAQDSSGVIDLATWGSSVIETQVRVIRVAIADPSIIDVLPVTSREIVINGKAAGTTSLLIWDAAGTRSWYNVRVSPDAANLEADLRRLFPGEDVRVKASGKSVILTGSVSNSGVASRMLDVAERSLGTPDQVINEMQMPRPGQVLLKVRFAEVSRSALERSGINLLYTGPDGRIVGSTSGRPGPFRGELEGAVPLGGASGSASTRLSDAVNLFLFEPELDLAALLQALESNGLFRSLSEPNLLAAHGVEASFLAGGEFPYPVVQGGNNSGSVSIVFKEFGVKLAFTPYIQPGGNIRLKVAPEVSSLDFSAGLILSGFSIPSILSRKASTEVELADGQTFAIAGLIDNSLIADYDKIPLLGDIPILGSLFRSKEMRQNRSELLVLVTPTIVYPEDQAPPVPGGEPETWNWEKHMDGPMPEPDEEGRQHELKPVQNDAGAADLDSAADGSSNDNAR